MLYEVITIGKTVLYLDDQKVAEGPMKTQPAKFTLSGDGLCVGYRVVSIQRRRVTTSLLKAPYRKTFPSPSFCVQYVSLPKVLFFTIKTGIEYDRITSYNVCYTKLLRCYSCFTTKTTSNMRSNNTNIFMFYFIFTILLNFTPVLVKFISNPNFKLVAFK